MHQFRTCEDTSKYDSTAFFPFVPRALKSSFSVVSWTWYIVLLSRHAATHYFC